MNILQYCVFGEVLGQEGGHVLVENSVCDGTGGYVGAFHHSQVTIMRSLIQSQVIVRDTAVLIGAGSAFLGSELDADEHGIMFLANTEYQVEPEAHSNGAIFEGMYFYSIQAGKFQAIRKMLVVE